VAGPPAPEKPKRKPRAKPAPTPEPEVVADDREIDDAELLDAARGFLQRHAKDDVTAHEQLREIIAGLKCAGTKVADLPAGVRGLFLEKVKA
jgi:hypothetical protein